MTLSEPVAAGNLPALYQADYFNGREYINYLGDKSAHQKTLARHLCLVRRYLPRGARLLEIGCAYGFFLELAQPLYPGSVGLDLSAHAVAHARACGLDAHEGDLTSQRFPEPFDGVCLWDTIEHLPHPEITLEKACDLLRPGGYVFLTTGDLGALLARLQGRHWRQLHPPTHLFYFTRPALRSLARRVGLKPEGFGTVCVHRRLGSALKALQGAHGALLGRLAAAAARVTPACLLRLDFPLNSGDTLWFAARKEGKMSA